MKDNKLKKGIEEIKRVMMTTTEKKQIFMNVINSPIPEKVSVYSRWSFYLFISKVHKSRLAYYVIAFLLIITMSGGVVFASESSLPDSVLYPIKVNVVEPIHEALTFSKLGKANYESNLATKRMVEAETLAVQGKLDTRSKKQINDLIIKHSKKLDEAINNIDNTKGTEQVDNIVTNFQEKMNTHAKALDVINTRKDNSNIEGNDNSVSGLARINAYDLGNKYKNNKEIKSDKEGLKWGGKGHLQGNDN